MPQSANRPTQQDLAKVLNLSRRAVSEALREQGGTVKVSEKTRTRVREMAEKLGYRQNLVARALRTGKTGKLGIIACKAGQDSISIRRLYYAVHAAEAMGEVPIVLHADSLNSQSCLEACHAMIDSKVDGVLLLSPSVHTFPQENVDLLREAGIFVNSLSSGWLKGISSYVHDKKQGFEQLTRHLVEEGNRSITLIAWDLGKQPAKKTPPKGQRYSHAREVIQGFQNVAEECRKSGKQIDFQIHSMLPEVFNQRLPVLGDLNGAFIVGYVAMRELIKKGKLPDAIMFQVDNWALGGLRACGEAGLSIPKDVAITGFENEPASSGGLVPITTVSHPLEELCRMAVQEVMDHIQGKPTQPLQKVKVKGELIIRQSSVRRDLPPLDLADLSFR